MTTMHEIKRLFSEYNLDLKEDSSIQLIDDYTGAHFRYNKHGGLLLGGDCYNGQLDDLQVSGIEIVPNGVEIYLYA